MIDLELGMRVLDDRDGESAVRKLADKLGHEGGLARILPAHNAEDERVHNGLSLISAGL